MNSNNRGIVLCFFVYLVLCTCIVSIIEIPWLVVPMGTGFKVNMTEVTENNPSFSTPNMSQSTNILWNASVDGSCGVSGYCYPFEDGSVMVSLLMGRWGQRCYQMNPISLQTGPGNRTSQFDTALHTPYLLTIAGACLMIVTWIVGVCSCCNHDCGRCTIYSVIAFFLTLGGTVFTAGMVLLFMFSNNESSCLHRICSANSSFSIGNCKLGWTLYVAVIGVILCFLLAIASCILANKTPLRSKGLNNPVREARGNKRILTSTA